HPFHRVISTSPWLERSPERRRSGGAPVPHRKEKIRLRRPSSAVSGIETGGGVRMVRCSNACASNKSRTDHFTFIHGCSVSDTGDYDGMAGRLLHDEAGDIADPNLPHILVSIL